MLYYLKDDMMVLVEKGEKTGFILPQNLIKERWTGSIVARSLAEKILFIQIEQLWMHAYSIAEDRRIIQNGKFGYRYYKIGIIQC